LSFVFFLGSEHICVKCSKNIYCMSLRALYPSWINGWQTSRRAVLVVLTCLGQRLVPHDLAVSFIMMHQLSIDSNTFLTTTTGTLLVTTLLTNTTSTTLLFHRLPSLTPNQRICSSVSGRLFRMSRAPGRASAMNPLLGDIVSWMNVPLISRATQTIWIFNPPRPDFKVLLQCGHMTGPDSNILRRPGPGPAATWTSLCFAF
jgi:hypothetical protein